MSKRTRHKQRRQPAAQRARLARAVEVHSTRLRTQRTRKLRRRRLHRTGPEAALYAERLPRARRTGLRIALIVAFAAFASGTAALHDVPLGTLLPHVVLSAADAAGLSSEQPWMPLADGELEQFERLRLDGAAEALVLPLRMPDLVREIIAQRTQLPREEAIRVADSLTKEARATGIDPLLVLAMIEVESKYDHTAVSHRGARGLMQLMPETRAWMIEKTPHLSNASEAEDYSDPASNVRVGVRYFAELTRSFRRLEHALQAYNCGPTRLIAILRGESVLPEESKFYAERVKRGYARLRRDYAYLDLGPAERT